MQPSIFMLRFAISDFRILPGHSGLTTYVSTCMMRKTVNTISRRWGRFFGQPGEWLEEENEDTSIAMDFLRRIRGVFDFKDVVGGHTFKPEWKAVVNLISRPWFSWLWVVQDVTLARQVTIYCGSQSANWDELETCVGLLEQKS